MATFSVTNTNNSGAGSLQQAVLDANALTGRDIIKFGGLFTDAIADTITLAGSSLVITDDLSINGTGKDLLSISGNNASRVFEISSDISVEIKGLTISKGFVDYSEVSTGGGGIYNQGTLTVSNASISSNKAYLGGGIYNTGILKVSNSIISNNNENDQDFGESGRGGGIYNSGISTVNNSTISGNVSFVEGGGIYNSGISTVNNSTISSNYSNDYSDFDGGGGIYNSDSGTLRVNYSTVSDNKGYLGAGIYSEGILSVSHSTISNNTSVEGGGIYNSGTLTVNDSSINSNFAYDGGGIKNAGILAVSHSTINSNNGETGGGISNSGTATVSDSTISENRSDYRAAGIYNTGVIKVIDSTIRDNTAGYYAGGIYNDGGILTVSNSTISGNFGAESFFSDGKGGGIYNSGTATVSNSTISGNTGEIGGGIYNTATLSVTSSTIDGNKVFSSYGGGIYNSGTATVSNSTISGNKAHFGGGVYNTGILRLSNSTIALNIALVIDTRSDPYYEFGDAGGIYNTNSGTAIVKNSIIAGNFDTPNDDLDNVINLDVVGNFISNGYNLIGSLGSSTGFNASEQLTVAITDVIDTTLRNNGGSVKTHALVTGSRAINGGKNADIPSDTTDQDGDGNTTEQLPFDERGSGFARVSGGRVDIGAFEARVNVINGNCGGNTLKGTAGNDIITGYKGKDTLTGGTGADAFVYTSIKDAGDTIADFEDGTDKIVLRQLFQKYGLSLDFDSAIAGGYLRFEAKGTNAIVLIDRDGSSGSGRAVKLVTVSDESVDSLNKAINFAF